jgi:hypothetical protein
LEESREDEAEAIDPPNSQTRTCGAAGWASFFPSPLPTVLHVWHTNNFCISADKQVPGPPLIKVPQPQAHVRSAADIEIPSRARDLQLNDAGRQHGKRKRGPPILTKIRSAGRKRASLHSMSELEPTGEDQELKAYRGWVALERLKPYIYSHRSFLPVRPLAHF